MRIQLGGDSSPVALAPIESKTSSGDLGDDSGAAGEIPLANQSHMPEKIQCESNAVAASTTVSDSDAVPIHKVKIKKTKSRRDELDSTWEELRQTDAEILSLQARLEICRRKRIDLDRHCRELLRTKDMETSIAHLLRLHDTVKI